jgi:hypothetical protein
MPELKGLQVVELPKWDFYRCVIPYALAKPIEIICGSTSYFNEVEFYMHNMVFK